MKVLIKIMLVDLFLLSLLAGLVWLPPSWMAVILACPSVLLLVAFGWLLWYNSLELKLLWKGPLSDLIRFF